MIKGVNGAALDITEVISNRTMILEHFSFQDPYYWRDQQKNSQQLDLKSSHFDTSVIPHDALKFIGNEIGRAIQLRNEKKIPILIVECTNSEGFIQYLSAIANQITNQQSGQFFVERYNEHIIQQLPIKNLPALLFGGIAKDLTDRLKIYEDKYQAVGSKILALGKAYNSSVSSYNARLKPSVRNLQKLQGQPEDLIDMDSVPVDVTPVIESLEAENDEE